MKEIEEEFWHCGQALEKEVEEKVGVEVKKME